MPDFVSRPSYAPLRQSRGGLLRHDHFEVCHVTNDIERARDVYRDRYGVRDFQQLVGDLPEGGRIHIELAWVGGMMYELLQASGPGADPYMHLLPEGADFAMRFHHLGYFIHDTAEWDAIGDEVQAAGGSVLTANDMPGFMRFQIVSLPHLGHYLEFILPEPAGVAFFENVPAN